MDDFEYPPIYKVSERCEALVRMINMMYATVRSNQDAVDMEEIVTRIDKAYYDFKAAAHEICSLCGSDSI